VLNDPECPLCGFPWSRFLRDGHLGCPDCYAAFRERLAPYLRQHHRTGLPQPEAASLRDQVRLHRREEWQRQQDDAVVREDYEEAARLRSLLAEEP
jgi:protein arginine kinase activator